jgi:outer membrane protein TolC
MAVGGAVVAAAYQNESREQREALAGVYERKIQLAEARMDVAKQQMDAAERRVAVGLENKNTVLEQRQALVEAEAQMRIARLNLEEVRLTGREPRDEASAPSVSNRDFVQERMVAGLRVTQAALETAKRKQQDAERRVGIGLAQPADVEVFRAELVALESALRAAEQKIAARRAFVAGSYDATLVDLHVAAIEAEQRHRALMPQFELARREKQRVESLVSKGLASPVEVTKANLRLLEIQTDLQRAEVEVSIARQQIAQRTGGKESGS